MMNKPKWSDAPAWAKHLWNSNQVWCWSETRKMETKALLCDEVDGKHNFKLWLDYWKYVEERP